jgi:hypothetical protein
MGHAIIVLAAICIILVCLPLIFELVGGVVRIISYVLAWGMVASIVVSVVTVVVLGIGAFLSYLPTGPDYVWYFIFRSLLWIAAAVCAAFLLWIYVTFALMFYQWCRQTAANFVARLSRRVGPDEVRKKSLGEG